MNTFPLDIDVLVSPSTSVFDALCTLNPPSPILTPSQLTFAWSSGDIPVLLYDEGYAEGNSDSLDSSALSSCIRDSYACPDNPVSAGISHSESQSGIPENPESSSTLTSVGTFGPRHRTRALRASHYSQNSSRQSLGPSSPSHISNEPSTRIGVPSRSSLEEESWTSSRFLSKGFYHPIVFVDRDKAPSHSADNNVSFEASELELLTLTVFEDSSIESRQSLAKPVSWISSGSWDYMQYKDYIANQGLSPHLSKQGLQDPGHAECEELSSTFPPAEKKDEMHTYELRHEVHEDESPRHHHSPEKAPRWSVKLSPLVPAIQQQLEFDWLDDIYLDFLIDQEGFRAAHPLLRFAGTVRQRWPTQVHPNLGNVMAQFKPVVRQTFHFHYAPFESPPILRRITVNGDDTYDYVSRQGLLSLKANGVYVLHGQESPTGSYHYDYDVVKLHWQFEYLVDDRVADSSGKIMMGEKTLTPLTFSCSPALLLPTQARKNSIIHVFKKSVAPKLHAEKLQPPVQGVPGPARSAGKGVQLNPLGLPLVDANIIPSKLQGQSSSHRRGKSHNIRDIEAVAKVKDSNHRKDKAVPVFTENESNSPPVRRRRNSSAGEHNDSPVKPQSNTIGPSTQRGYHGEALTGRHIIPPKKLAQMFNSYEKENSVHHSTNPHRTSNYISPLAPRPRHTTAKIRDPLL